MQFKTKKGVETHLYNLKDDIGETNNVADQFPDLVTWLQKLSVEARTKSKTFPSFMDAHHTE